MTQPLLEQNYCLGLYLKMYAIEGAMKAVTFRTYAQTPHLVGQGHGIAVSLQMVI
ncbi:MAG: hypothetical protein LDL41_21830 [Coleofasciculus sp. S288]|nr:hypothetical protein [Coleofasciculus sp. S288]